jgi:hypothetical protein
VLFANFGLRRVRGGSAANAAKLKGVFAMRDEFTNRLGAFKTTVVNTRWEVLE